MAGPWEKYAQTDPGKSLLDQAQKDYPYLANSGLVATYSDKGAGNRKLEYWPRGEPGNAQMPRPSSIPIDSAGVEIFDRSVSPKDILADYVSHEAVNSDPELKRMYSEFAASVPDAKMHERYDYHRRNLGEKRDYETWKERSGMPEYFRGYTFDQWQDAKRFYSPEQLKKLDEIRGYVGIDKQTKAAGPWAKYAQAPASTQPPAAPEQPTDQRPTGDLVDAVNETAMSLGSGAVAMPIAGLAGLGAMGTRALGLTESDPADVVRRVQSALTYEPRTKAGSTAAGIVSYPFEKLAQGADWAGQKTLDATGSPLAATAVNTALQATPALLARRGGRRPATVERGPSSTTPVDRPVAPSAAAPAAESAAPPQRPPGLARVSEGSVPTRAELAEAAQAAYKRADEAGVVVSGNSLFKLKTRVASMAKKEGIDKDLHPDSSAALRRILETKGQKTLSELETLRKIAKDAQGSMKPADKRLAGKIVDELDDYIDNLSGADVVAGDATKAAALKEARGYYSRAKKSEVLETLVQRAKDSAPNYSASGLENAIRTEFRALAKNDKKMRMFTKEEQAAIRKVAQGGKMENAMRFIGKFAPTGVVSGTLAGGFATTMMGPAGLGVPVAGLAGRYAATRMTMKNVSKADELVRRGPAGANALAKETADKKRNALADF